MGLKRVSLLCLILFHAQFLWAFEGAEWRLEIQRPQDWTLEIHEGEPPREEPHEPREPRERRARRPFNSNRAFELSLMQTSVHAANDFIAYGDIFQSPFRILRNLINADSFEEFRNNPTLYYRDNISFAIDDFFSGFMLNFGFEVTPLSININVRDRWGFGLDLGRITTTGNLTLPESVLNLHEVTDETFGAGGAVFVDVGVPVFFHVGRAKVRLRPSAFFPLVYVRPNIVYSFGPSDAGGSSGQRMEISYDIRVFSPFNMEGLFGGEFDALADPAGTALGIARNNLGYDFSLGVEFPVHRLVSVGVNFTNVPIPFLAATLDHYARVRGSAFFDTSYIDLGGVLGDDWSFPSEAYGFSTEDPSFGVVSGGQRVRRPFTMLLYANYRPFDRRIVTLVPSLGFSVNQLYARPVALEGGLSARLDLGNIFITTIGLNYNDRRWRNSLDLALNLRLIELGVGLSMQSPDFVKSFRGAGFGVNFGVRMGW